MGLILSIDVGTTNVKAALVDEDGRIVGAAKSVGMKIEGDAKGKAEHDPDKLQAALLEVCRLAIGERGREIECFALTSYMFGVMLVDKDDRPLTGISTFLDTTSQAHYPKFLEAIGDADRMYARTGCPPIFQYPVSRLHHIATNNPGVLKKVAHVVDSKAFILRVLTGEYCTDYSTANSMGCLNIDGSWDRELIAAIGYDAGQFPRVLDGFTEKVRMKDTVCADFGLKTGTTIAVGLYDGAAVAGALTGFEAQVAVGNFGTSGMLRVPTTMPIQDFEGGAIQNCLLKPGTFFTGSGINNCTIASNMLLGILGLELDYLRSTALSVPGANGIMTFPYIAGERDKVIGNIGTGVVFGLGIASTRDDLARSFLEGVAFSFLFVKQRLDPQNRIKEFRLGGGGSANLQWMQIIADVLNLPIRLSQNPEMGIIGAACLARYGDGPDLLACSRRIMQDAIVVTPDAANAKIYAEIAGRYFAVRASLREPLLARQGSAAA